MATVSFANMDQEFNVLGSLVTFTGAFSQFRDASTFVWSSATTPANGVYVLGNGFVFDGGGVPIAGTITRSSSPAFRSLSRTLRRSSTAH